MKTIAQKLLDWFQINRRELPWRNTNDPYAIWVSEVMLQQTQVNTVIPYYERFLDNFPDITILAKAHSDQVLKMWEGLGYYARAINLQKASKMVVNRFSAQVPSDPSQFKELPGVGDYINAAVQSIAFGHSMAVVDGNVRRVLSRLYEMPETVNESKYSKKFANKAQSLICKKSPGDYNQAIMELGALICIPKNPQCNMCPLTKNCKSFIHDTIFNFPRRKKKSAVPTQNWVAAVIQKDNKFLLTQRKAGGFLGGLWEFPGGKICDNEPLQSACIRHIQEQLQINIQIKQHISQIKHKYTHFSQIMDAFLCDFQSGTIHLNGPSNYKWIYWSEIDQFALPKSNLKFIKEISKNKKMGNFFFKKTI
jgi:A/G-specific adenine glycosylase